MATAHVHAMALLDQIGNFYGAFQQGIGGVDAKMDKIGGRHGGKDFRFADACHQQSGTDPDLSPEF